MSGTKLIESILKKGTLHTPHRRKQKRFKAIFEADDGNWWFVENSETEQNEHQNQITSAICLKPVKACKKMDWLTAKVNGNDRADNRRNLKEVETTLDLR